MSVVGLMGSDSDQVIDDQIIETTSSRLRRYYLNRKLDAGSVPVSTTNNETPTVLGWGFFLPDRAGSRVLLGGSCRLRQPPELAVPGHIPLLLTIPRSDLAS